MPDIKEYLLSERQSIVAQRDNAMAVFNQAVGALALLDAALKNAEPQEYSPETTDGGMPLQEFAEMVGGKGATAEIIPVGQAENE